MSSMQTNHPRTRQSGPSADQTKVMKFAKESHPLPSLMGGGYGTYQVHPENFLISFVTHAAGILALLWVFHVAVIGPKIEETHASIMPLSPPPNLYHIGKNGNNAGGGGDASKLKASTGTPPRAALKQFTPPQVLPPRESKLQVEPTIIADLKIPQSNQIGDPLSKRTPASNGSGTGGGIGNCSGGGVGPRRAPAVAPGAFLCSCSCRSPPQPLYKPEPEVSEEARKAKD